MKKVFSILCALLVTAGALAKTVTQYERTQVTDVSTIQSGKLYVFTVNGGSYITESEGKYEAPSAQNSISDAALYYIEANGTNWTVKNYSTGNYWGDLTGSAAAGTFTPSATAGSWTLTFSGNNVQAGSNGFFINRSSGVMHGWTSAINLQLYEVEVKSKVIATSEAELNSGKAYNITTADRGAWYIPEGGTQLTSTTKAGVAINGSSATQQFAFVPFEGKLYLYSVSEQKFVNKSGNYTTLSSTPDNPINLLATSNASYPTVLALNGSNQMGVSNGYNPAIITFWNDLNDAGNQAQIIEAVDFDAAAIGASFIHVTYKLKVNGEIIASQSGIAVVGSAVDAPEAFKNVFATTITSSVSTITSETTEVVFEPTFTGLPFEFSTSYENAHWYYLTLRNKWAALGETAPYPCTSGDLASASDKNLWAFVGSPYGVKVINKAAGSGKYLEATNDNPSFTTTEQEWVLGKNDYGFTLHPEGTIQYINDNANKGVLGYWNSSNAAGDGGSAMVAIESVDAVMPGTYFIQNASGDYLTGANNWGTQASVGGAGAPFVAEMLTNGNYAFKHSMVTINDKYLGSNLFTDSATPASGFAVSKTDDGYYTITLDGKYLAQGTNTGSTNDFIAVTQENLTDAAKWKFLTEAEAVAGLAAATQDAPVTATFLIKNPGFNRNVSTGGWTMVANNQNLSGGADHNRCAESWRAAFTLSQTLNGLPDGVYAMTVQAALTDYANLYDGADYPVAYLNDATSPFQNMEGSDRGSSMGTLSDAFTAGKYYLDVVVAEVTGGTITLGVKGTRTNTWCIWDNFKLFYHGTGANIATVRASYDYPRLSEQAAAYLNKDGVSEGTKAAIQAALGQTATIPTTEEAYNAVVKALKDVVTQAETDINNKPIIDAMYAFMESFNVYTADAYNTYKGLADGYKAAYEAGTLTEQLSENPLQRTDWQHEAALKFDDLLLSAWTIGGEQAKDYEKALYINTWSVEGESDGTNFLVPFYEYWTGDANSLAANEIQATVEGLDANSLYAVNAWVRVHTKSDVAGADANGITLQVGNGTAVTVNKGDQITNAANNCQFNVAEYVVYGATDANGKLTITFNIAADNNISWLSFKNMNYASVSDVYNEVLAAAKALVDADKEATAQQALTDCIATYGAVDQSDADAVLEAIEKLRAIVAPTQASIDLYKDIAKAMEVVKAQATTAAAGLGSLDDAYAAGAYHAVADMFVAYQAIEGKTLINADETAAQLSDPGYADFTSLIINPSFETGDMTGWSVTSAGWDTGVRELAEAKFATSKADGKYIFNNWAGYVTTLDLNQTVKGLPNGNYTLTGVVAGYGDEAPITIKANTEEIVIAPKADNVDAEVHNGYEFTIPVKVTTGELVIYVKNDGKGNTFFKADNFKLLYEPLSDLALNAVGGATFAVKDGQEGIDAKQLDHEGDAITDAERTNNTIEVGNAEIKHGIQVQYAGVDAVNTEIFECGFRAAARITDSKGNVFTVKTRGDKNTNIINVAEGVFGPSEEYEVVIEPITYYNYDKFCDEIYTQWEEGKATHQIDDPADPSGVSKVTDPTWTLEAAARAWTANKFATDPLFTNAPDPVDGWYFDYCDPMPYYCDNTKHVFLIKTDDSVKANVKSLGAQDFKAFDKFGNDWTDEFLTLNGGIATGVNKLDAANGKSVIYNVAGQRVAKAQKGIYVVNGKKVAVK